jgi:4-amino-4-deoxy-L-arabinose transferase-like glycosyltransferase
MSSLVNPIHPERFALTRRLAWLIILLAAALFLRLLYGMALDPLQPYTDYGSDTGWYLEFGARFLRGGETGPLTPPPLYLMFVGFPQLILSPEAAIYMIRLLQILASTATCYFAYRIGRAIGGERAGLFGLGLLAFNPIFIMESGHITSETLHLFFLGAALAAYVETLQRDAPLLRHIALVGVLFALATLTRAALLAFPFGIVIHLFLAYRPARAIKYSAALLVVFALVLSTWTIYYKLRWDRWIIAGEGLAGFLYIGTVGWDGPWNTDEQLETHVSPDAANAPREEQYINAAANIILSDIGAYLSRRASEWASAYLTPHGVHWFPGESLREVALNWLRSDFTPDGFVRLVQSDAFAPKLVFYVVHYAGLILGLFGIWTTRRQWRLALPLIGFIAYITLIHFVLFALPRYIFPATLCYWIFAALWLNQRLPTRSNTIEPYA